MKHLIGFEAMQQRNGVGGEQVKNCACEVAVSGEAGRKHFLFKYFGCAIGFDVEAAFLAKGLHLKKLYNLLGCHLALTIFADLISTGSTGTSW